MESNNATETGERPKRRSAKKPKPIRRPYMDGFTAVNTLEQIYEIGATDVEKEINQTFSKNQWFLKTPVAVPPYSQFNGAPKDSDGRRWGRRSNEEDMLNLRLPVARKFDSIGRTVDFPQTGSVITVDGIGTFIVEEVIVPEGRRITAQVKVKWVT